MVTTAQVKEYLEIPYNDRDTMIAGIIQDGYDYLANAVSNFQELYDSNAVFARQADSFVKHHYFPAYFDDREGMLSANPSLNYAARSLLTQLQMYEYEEVEND